jgi:hypothetical protein
MILKRYPYLSWGGRWMRVRPAAVLGGIVVVLIGGAISLWFFSNPGRLSRYQATSALAFATQALALSAVTGFAAMATLEILKRLLHLRAWFFLGQVRGLESMLGRPDSRGSAPSRRESVRRLDIPLEQLMARLGYAVDQALDEQFIPADRALRRNWRDFLPTS